MRTKNILFVAFIIVLTYGCVSPMKSFNTNSNGWKPSDFKPQNGILLIERVTPKAQQKKIEDYMAKDYPFKYEFVDIKDLEANEKKYADKNTYRFALVYSYSTQTLHENDITRKPLNVGAFDFNFIDRLNNKEYPKSGIASSWSSMTFKKIIQTCLEKQ